MKYNKKKYFINCYKQILKYGSIKSNYFKLKKIKKKLIILLNKYFKKEVFFYLIKIKNKKGDNSLIGEFKINFFIVKKYLN